MSQSMMKAAVIDGYGGVDVLRIAQVPMPALRPNDLLIRVHASSVNPVDAKQRQGIQRVIVRKKMPAILGMDVAGVVEAVGPRVRGFAPGDRVWSSPSHKRSGCWAEFVAVDAGEAALTPPSLSDEDAASLPLVGLTAWECLHGGVGLHAEQRVFVQAGSGGVGTIAIQLARHAGAVVATTCSPRNADLMTRLGAQVLVDYRSQDFVDVLGPQDQVLESVGPEAWVRALSVIRRGGQLSAIATGLPGTVGRYGPVLGPIAMLGPVMLGKLRGLLCGVRFRVVVRPASGEKLAALGALAEAGAVRAVVEEVFPLADIAEANRRVEAGRTVGKIVIRVAP